MNAPPGNDTMTATKKRTGLGPSFGSAPAGLHTARELASQPRIHDVCEANRRQFLEKQRPLYVRRSDLLT